MAADVDAFRPVWAEIDLEAVRANVRAWRALVAPAAVCAVVKADGYGHGAIIAARAFLDAGADWLGVALVEEGLALRHVGITSELFLATALTEEVPELVEGHLYLAQLGRVVIRTLLQCLLLGDELCDPLDQVAVVHFASPIQGGLVDCGLVTLRCTRFRARLRPCCVSVLPRPAG